MLRVVSAVALGVPTVVAIAWGRPALELWLALFVILMAREWHMLCGGRDWTPARLALAVAAVLVLILATVDAYGAAVVVVGIAIPVVYLLARREAGLRWGWTASGVLYIGLTALALSWLRAVPDVGLLNLLWVFAVVWATDSAAYAVGRTIGGPKLAPPISPNKTWSGAVGGLVGAGVVGGVLGWAEAGPTTPALAGMALSVVAQAGDLAESAVKRRFGVKDSGAIIPGHGGLFDRVDALLAAAPVAALGLYVVGADALWR
ncbi:MAG: phosphatidate cytidylyltransferase [Gemmatimonas sp.]